jgi:hypothetical protein
MKSSIRTTLAAAALAITGAANFASLPSATFAAAGISAGLMMGGQAMAATKTIPGIGIRVKKSPGGSTSRTAPVKSGADGSFNFTGLEAGEYEVTPDGGKSAIFKVGSDGKLSGVVQSDGGAPTVAPSGTKDSAVKGATNPSMK